MRRFLPLLLVVAVAGLAACGDDPDVLARAEPDEVASDTGTVAVRLEEVSGAFIEGFEIGLRFETTDGEVIASTLWTDFVESQGEPSMEAYYESVLEQSVPAGEVTVLATVNLGIGPAPEVPDLDGDLRCRLVVDVPADGRVEVEVSFSGEDDCLREV